VYANLTTVLDLLGRRDEAIAVAYEGIAEAERAGQATVYGNFLRANAADSLFFLGRWPECRRLCLDALSWNPVGIWYLASLLPLAILEVATTSGESAGRLLGQVLLAIETVQDPQYSVPAQQAVAAYALWQADLVDAHRAAERGWLRVSDTEDWLLMARMAATCLEVDATIALDARRRHDLSTLASARERSLPVLLRAEAVVRACGVSTKAGSRVQADLAIRTARAFRSRLEGHDEPATWSALGRARRSIRSCPSPLARGRSPAGPGPRTLHSDRGPGAADRRRGSGLPAGGVAVAAGRGRAGAAGDAIASQADRSFAGSPARSARRVRPVRRPDRDAIASQADLAGSEAGPPAGQCRALEFRLPVVTRRPTYRPSPEQSRVRALWPISSPQRASPRPMISD
jgi:hypothetical protein